jgi:hypothetical protein
MNIQRLIKKSFITMSIVAMATLLVSPLYCQSHIKELDGVRKSMTDLGGSMPEMIKKSKNNELRTLERVFEINTYALTTIEAYLKMIRVTLVSKGNFNRDVIGVFNGWLEFMRKYCRRDLEYLDEAAGEIKNDSIIEVIKKARVNIKTLDGIAAKGISENGNLLAK